MYIKNTFYYIIYTYYKMVIFLFYGQKSVTCVTSYDYQLVMLFFRCFFLLLFCYLF